jgi:hypothetical protein
MFACPTTNAFLLDAPQGRHGHHGAVSHPSRQKTSLEFIMNAEVLTEEPEESEKAPIDECFRVDDSEQADSTDTRLPFDIFRLPNGLVIVAPADTWSPHTLLSTFRQPPSRTAGRRATDEERRRRRRQCTTDGCTNFIINRGRCFRHGVI